jgi:hypothetical protein
MYFVHIDMNIDAGFTGFHMIIFSSYFMSEGSCEHGNEPSGFIKCWEVLEWLHNWQLLKKGSAP